MNDLSSCMYSRNAANLDGNYINRNHLALGMLLQWHRWMLPVEFWALPIICPFGGWWCIGCARVSDLFAVPVGHCLTSGPRLLCSEGEITQFTSWCLGWAHHLYVECSLAGEYEPFLRDLASRELGSHQMSCDGKGQLVQRSVDLELLYFTCVYIYLLKVHRTPDSLAPSVPNKDCTCTSTV